MNDRRRPAPPWTGRLLVRLRRLGDRRSEIEADLRELFDARVASHGRRHASLRYLADALSLWRWRVGAFAASDRAHARVRWTPLLHEGARDAAFAVRMFMREPGIVLMTVAGLSLAIAVSTVILTIVNALTLRPTGVAAPESLYSVSVSNLHCGCTAGGYSPMQGNWSSTDFARLAAAVSSMDLAGDSPFTPFVELRTAADRAAAQSLPIMAVSGSYFRLLGARTAVGRPLEPADDTTADLVAVISHTLWKVRFAADPAVVGRTLWLDDVPLTVVGVAERGFVGSHGAKFQTAPAAWITFASQERLWSERQADVHRRMTAEIEQLSRSSSPDAVARMRLDALRATLASAPERWSVPVDVAGRLRPGATAAQAEAELSAIAQAFAADGRPERNQPPRVQLGPADQPRSDPTQAAIVAAVVAVLLALACSNVTNLLLANAARRRREIGTRLALGAGRGRLIRQLLTESVLLGGCAGVAGLLLASWGTPAIAALLPLPALVDLGPDLRVYLLAAMITLVAGLFAGLAPAAHGVRGDLLSALRGDRPGGTSSPGQNRLRSVLVGAQAAACVVLLVLAALLTRSALAASRFDTGVAIDRLVNVSPNLGPDYDAARTRLYLSVALERLEQLPGVAGAALATVPPFHTFHARMTLPGTAPNGEAAVVQRNDVSPDYFETVGVRLIQGRTFTEQEVRNQEPVAIISSRLAQQFWGGASPIGSTLERVWGPPDKPGAQAGLHRKPAGTRVIGVVTDTMTQLDDHRVPTIYLPIDTADAVPHLVVATTTNPRAVVGDITREVRALDPNQTPYVLLPHDKLQDGLRTSRTLAGITGVVGVSALALALTGLFGVTSFVVGQRRHEVGIRMALGATARQVVGMFVRESLRPVLIGLTCGLALALAAGQLMKSMLLGISGHDPLAIGSAIALLLGTAGMAALVPARRAAAVDPTVTLKQE